MTNDKTMTTLYFGEDNLHNFAFLGLDARPEDYDQTLDIAVASPAQIAKIERAIADGVRYEVQIVSSGYMRPDTVRVHTYGTHKSEARRAMHQEAQLVTNTIQWLLAQTDGVIGGTIDPYLANLHTRQVDSLPTDLRRAATSLADLIRQYVEQFGPKTSDAQDG